MAVDSRLSNRLQHAEKLWQEYVGSGQPRQLDKWLSERLRGEKKFGSQDRRFYSDLLFSCARTVTTTLFQSYLQKQFHLSDMQIFSAQREDEQQRQVERFSGDVADEASLWSALACLNARDVVGEAWSSIQALEGNETKSSTWRNDILKQIHTQTELSDGKMIQWMPRLLIAHGIPPVWAPALVARMQRSGWSLAQVVEFVRVQNSRSPLWIRLNRTEVRGEVDADLRSHDLEVVWMENQTAAIVRGSFGVYQSKSFQAGYFEVQDGASQQIAATVAAQPGEKIWDSCAGGGGKTVALASALQGKGALYASDIREHKLQEARRRCLRAGFHNIRTLVWDGDKAPTFGKEVHLQAGFDAVLVDAPCSSSGTWRRNPDARLRISNSQARSELYELQFQLLLNAAKHVRPGGRVVYGTCSWCVDENETVAERFKRERQPEFNSTVASEHGVLLGAPLFDADTMFAVRFERPSLTPTIK